MSYGIFLSQRPTVVWHQPEARHRFNKEYSQKACLYGNCQSGGMYAEISEYYVVYGDMHCRDGPSYSEGYQWMLETAQGPMSSIAAIL